MCWNATVSLNTFLFSASVVALAVYNSNFTQYKIPEFSNVFFVLFLMSFVLMQLIEFFIWRNIDDPSKNHIFSVCATLLLISQPFFSLALVNSLPLRHFLMIMYSIFAVPYAIHVASSNRIRSSVSQTGHLRWQFSDASPVPRIAVILVWFFFFLFSFVYEKRIGGLAFALITLLICFLNYRNDNTMWSMWCWIVNSVMIYYAFYLVLYLPFRERGELIC